MKRTTILIPVIVLLTMLLVSCSGNGGVVVVPDTSGNDAIVAATGSTVCLGLWQFTADKVTGEVSLVQLRSADRIINVLGFMEPPALNMMDLDWPALVIADPIIEVGVILTHPLASDPSFMGFDVRGVCFGPEVTNADGLTVVTSPEYFKGVPFGYLDGLLGVPDSVANYGGLAGYKYFCDGLNATEDLDVFFSDTGNLDDRGSFGAGNTHQRDYILDWTNSDHAFFVFNYAIYANYDWPVGAAPWDVDDWDIMTANSAEAFCAKVTETANSLWYSAPNGGGEISLDVEAWDWQGDIEWVSIESVESGVIPTEIVSISLAGSTPFSYVYEFNGIAATPNSSGDLGILITVTDPVSFGEAWFLGLLSTGNSLYNALLYNCFLHTTTVTDCPMPTCESTDPASGGGDVGTVVFTCTNLVDGASLGVRLTDGTDDYIGTDVVFNSATEMEADIDLTGATGGDTLDIIITNGCGTEGTGPATFDVLFNIHSVGGPYTIGFASRDIYCNPSANQFGVNSNNIYSSNWRRYNNTSYSSYTNMYFQYGIGYGLVDAQDNSVLSCLNNYGSNPGRFNAFSYSNWSGALSGYSYPTSGNHIGLKGIANLQGSLKHIWALYDESNYSRFRWCRSITPQSVNYYTPGGSFYGGSGTSGVIAGHVRAMDMAVYPGSGDFYAYVLENGTGNVSIEKWVVPGTTYDSSIGDTELDNPIDLSVDSDGNIYVLNDPTGDPEIWMYDSDGNLVGGSGPIPSSLMPGNPLRLDVHLFADPDEVHVLWQWGVTRFSAY